MAQFLLNPNHRSDNKQERLLFLVVQKKDYLETHPHVTPEWLYNTCRLGGRNASIRDYTESNCGPLYGFYNNWFVSRVGFWLQPQVQAFLAHVAQSGKIYTMRWNDILWQSVAVQTFAPRQPTPATVLGRHGLPAIERRKFAQRNALWITAMALTMRS